MNQHRFDKIALNVFNKPWLIDPQSALNLFAAWDSMRHGDATWSYKKAMGYDDDGETSAPLKSSEEIFQALLAKESVAFAPSTTWELQNFEGFDGAKVAIIRVEGALMKGDYCGSLGTASLRTLTQIANNTKSVETILFINDSPGGTVDGTQSFAEEIYSSPKHTIGFIDGLCCSADYWITSSCKEVVASGDTDIIGSIGTMLSFYDWTGYMKKNGIVLREYYATKSTDKNTSFRQARDGDGKKLIQEMLDPMNNIFLGSVKRNREGKLDLEKQDVLTGKTYTSQDALSHGLIDSIGSLENVISSALSRGGNKSTKSTSMKGKNLVFQNVLTVTGAESLPVVEGGFLMTEEQLTALDGVLGQHAVELSAAQKQANAAANGNTEALKAAQDEASAEKAKAEGLQTKLTATETELNKLKQEKADMETSGKQFFGNPGAQKKDPPGAHEDADAIEQMSQLAHNKTATEEGY